MRARTVVAVLAVMAGLSGPYDMVAKEEIAAMWRFDPAHVARYTEPADKKYQEALLRVLTKAYRYRSDFRAPVLLQTSDKLDIWIRRWTMLFEPVMMVRRADGGAILIDKRSLAVVMSDKELECAIGHELGHVIDIQTGRTGELFEPIRCYSSEDFADVMGAFLCGADEWPPFFRKYVGYNFITLRNPCDVPAH